MISSYSSSLVGDIIRASANLAALHKYEHIEPEHILLAIVDESLKNFKEDNTIIKVFKRLKIDLFSLMEDIEASFHNDESNIPAEKIQLSHEAEQIFTNSSLEARLLYSYLIEAEHILLAYLNAGSAFVTGTLARKYNLGYDVVRISIRTVS